MQIETLKQFCDVIRLRSFSRAAELHGLTQSTLSQGVHLLEKTFNTALINRTVRPWQLTPEGEQCYREIRELVGRFEALKKSFQARKSNIKYNIRVAAIYSVGLRYMNTYIKNFKNKNEHADIILQCLHPDEVYESVRSNEADMGIVSFPNNMKIFDITSWKNEPMVIACAPDHNLARKNKVDITKLNGINFIHFNNGLNIRREIDQLFKRHAVKVHTVLEFDNIEAIKRAVETNAGVALLPLPAIEWEVATDTLKSVTLNKIDFNRSLCIITKKGKVFHRSVETFINHLKKN